MSIIANDMLLLLELNLLGDVWMSNSEVGCAYSVNVALAENNISWSDQKEVDISQCSILNECAAIHEKAVQNQVKPSSY